MLAGMGGAGELAAGVDSAIDSGRGAGLSSMATSLSGFMSLLLCMDTSLASLVLSLLSEVDLFPPFHEDISQTTPVKLLTVNALRSHLRHGLPDLSRARRPAFIAP